VPPGTSPARTALLLVAASLLIHVAYAGLVPLSPQEAYYWGWGRRLDLSYFDHPPLAAWSIRAATALLGDGERAIRMAAVGHAGLLLLFLFLAGRRLFGGRAALLATGFALLSPLASLGQLVITPDAPLLSGWAACLYLTVRALDEEDGRWLLAAGLAAGLAALGKYTAFLLVPQVGLALLLDPRGRRLLAGPWPWLGLLVAALVFSPVLAWNAARDLASLRFQSAARLQALAFDSLQVARFAGLQALTVSPLLWLALVAAPVVAARRWREPSLRIAAIFSLPLLLLMLVLSPFLLVKMNWGAPAYPAALLAAAALALERWHRPWVRRFTWCAGGLAAASAIYMHAIPLVPALPFPARDQLFAGWRQLAGRVEVERRAMGDDPLVVGCSYKPAAELAYYLPGRPEVQSAGIFGEDGLQFDVWLDPAALRGRALLLVIDPRERRRCEEKTRRCAPLTRLEPEVVTRGGELVTAFELYRCRLAPGAEVALPAWRRGSR
jgi:4-amino-4-deoxy-L-arabinose transferase-like glycosyltransferase